jgi:hypothetical protein
MVLVPIICSGQRERYQIKTNVPILFVAMWNVQFQKKLKDDKAFQVSLVGVKDHVIFVDTEASGYMLTVDYKAFFPKRKEHSVRYFAPFVRYENFMLDGNQDKVRITHPGCGLMFGQERTFWKKEILDVYFGFNYFPDKYQIISTDGFLDVVIPSTLHGLGPRLGVSLGYKF